MLGASLALLSAAAFALNLATARRGMVTGTATQAMAISVPLGLACFLAATAITGELFRSGDFPPRAAAWMAGFGILHFGIGRYCNFLAGQAAGVNLVVPVIQLNIVVTLALAVFVLHEPCTALQVIGGVLIVAGSIVAQRSGPGPIRTTSAGPSTFVPRLVAGYFFAALAALAYGSSPIIARFSLAETGPVHGLLGGLVAYATATGVILLMLLVPSNRRNVIALDRPNLRWFVLSAIFVAIAQGFFFAAVAVAPIMLVTPLLQLALVFTLLISKWLNPNHEVLGPNMIVGVVISIIGAMWVSIDTDVILDALAIPGGLAHALRWKV